MARKTKAEAAQNQHDEQASSVSRRNFIRTAAFSGGAAAAAMTGQAAQASVENPLGIRRPQEFDLPASTPLPKYDFGGEVDRRKQTDGVTRGMTGADIFAKACKDEGVKALFCCPGNYQIITSMANQGIPAYGGRNEGSMCSAADAFIRVTGELAVASGTEGPGFTNMICAIAAASASRTPLMVVASNMDQRYDDTERSLQRCYQQPMTEGIRKYGKRVVTGERIHEYAGYAFRALRTGVPGPVHLDFVTEASTPDFAEAGELDLYHDKTKYRTESRPHPDPADIRKAAEMIQAAARPMIVASTGVFYSKAWDALLKVAEKNQIAVVESAPMRGQFSDGHALSASTAPDSILSADLVILVGQYCMPSVGEFKFPPEAKWIRIHPEAGDIGRNLPIDLGIVSCERAALEALAEELPARQRPEWVQELADARAKFEAENEEYYAAGKGFTDGVHQAVIAKELADFLHKGDIPRDQTAIVAGGFGIARYVRRFVRAYRPGQICNGAYQYGSIGPDVGYAMGVGVAVKDGIGAQAAYKGSPIVCVTGDAGFGYSGMEIETLSKYRIPAVIIVWNNNAWGTWPGGSRDPHVGHVHLFQENVRYDKMAEALGGHGEYATTPDEFTPALKRAYQVAMNESRPAVINCQGKKEFSSGRPGMLGKLEPGCMAYNH